MKNYLVGGLKVLVLLVVACILVVAVNKTYKKLKPEPSCNKSIYDYTMDKLRDSKCMVKKVQLWLHGRTYPSRTQQFSTKPPNTDGHSQIPATVDEILGRKKGGFFVECGAFDGEIRSQTMFFELKRNWTGLLIEPNDESFAQLLEKNRNAFSVNTCLSSSSKAERVTFRDFGTRSGIVGKGPDAGRTISSSVHVKTCVPLYTLLTAVGNPIVDFFALDVEGAEIGVLKSLPWGKIVIKVISIEIKHINGSEVDRIMKSKGYCRNKIAHGKIAPGNKANLEDAIYVHKHFFPNSCGK